MQAASQAPEPQPQFIADVQLSPEQQRIADSIQHMTSDEVRELLYRDVGPEDLVGMPEYIALEIICWDHFDQRLRDWAWNSLDD